MAQNFLNTGTAIGNREDLADFIRDVNYKRTPFLSMAGKATPNTRQTAKAIVHEWVEDTLDVGKVNTNTKAEGFTPAYAAGDNDIRIRRGNNLEIISRSISVSRTQNRVDKAGLGQQSEYDKQLERRTLELPLDMNITLWQQTPVTRSADAGTASQMKGYFNIATIHTRALTNPAIITEELMAELLQEMVEDGIDPDAIYCSGFNKRSISGWMQQNRRYDNSDKRYVNMVELYESDWGTQKVIYDKHVPSTSIAVMQQDQARVAYLDPYEHIYKDQTKSGIDGEQGYVLSELTLEFGAQKCMGSITNLKAS